MTNEKQTKYWLDKYVTLTDDMALFWRGPLSQWWYSPFTWWESPYAIGGQRFNCAEQYMMALKAQLFRDQDTYKDIMNADGPFNGKQSEWNVYPRQQQAYGRRVKGFDLKTWENACRSFVYVGNLLKFTQDDGLKDLLLATGNRLIVEASPIDRIWGIGLAADNPLAWNQSTWRGTNFLGDALTKVRDEIRNAE